MKAGIRACTIMIVACMQLASTAAMAADQLTVTPVMLGQRVDDNRFYAAQIRIRFTSDHFLLIGGVGEVTFGGGFTVSCPSSSTPTPLVGQTVHFDPIAPFTIINRSITIGGPMYGIPGYEQMQWNSVQICNLIYNTAANFANFPLNMSITTPIVAVSITAQEIEVTTPGFFPFEVVRGGVPCVPDHGEIPVRADVPAACDPLLLDLGLDGINLGPRGVGVNFDHDGDGVMEHSQWVRQGGNEAFLVLDINGNGVIDDGTELFGTGTVLTLENIIAPNGFVALAQYDDPALGGNDDGAITSADAIWSQLLLWLDSDANGRSTPGEIMSLGSRGIRALPTIPRTRMVEDAAGNVIPFHATALTSAAPGRMQMVDVFFRSL